jgi:hypothetical protein
MADKMKPFTAAKPLKQQHPMTATCGKDHEASSKHVHMPPALLPWLLGRPAARATHPTSCRLKPLVASMPPQKVVTSDSCKTSWITDHCNSTHPAMKIISRIHSTASGNVSGGKEPYPRPAWQQQQHWQQQQRRKQQQRQKRSILHKRHSSLPAQSHSCQKPCLCNISSWSRHHTQIYAHNASSSV